MKGFSIELLDSGHYKIVYGDQVFDPNVIIAIIVAYAEYTAAIWEGNPDTKDSFPGVQDLIEDDST